MGNKSMKIKPIKKNNKTLKVVATSVLLAGVVGGSSLAVGLYHENIKSWFNKQKTYSYDEVQEMINENNQSWESKLKNLISNSDELKNQLTEITKAKLESDARINELEIELNQTIETDQARIAELQNALEEEKQNNSNLDTQIESLNAQIIELNQKIAMYEDLIQQYENDATAPVSYYDGETLIKATLVSKGSTYSLDTSLIPANSETREFIGWAVDNTEVDASTYVINTATVFTAVFKYKVDYVINDETTSLMIKQGTELSANAPEVTPGANQEFAGWVDTNGQTVNLTSQINSSITIIAQFNTVYNITFNYDDKSETIRLVNGEFESDVPTPTKTGYFFKGWKDDSGTLISKLDLNSLTEDTNLTAYHIKQFEITIAYRIGTGSYTNYQTKVYTMPGTETNQYLVYSDLMNIVYEIQLETGKTASGNCVSLSSSNNPYLTLQGVTGGGLAYSSNTTIYITLN